MEKAVPAPPVPPRMIGAPTAPSPRPTTQETVPAAVDHQVVSAQATDARPDGEEAAGGGAVPKSVPVTKPTADLGAADLAFREKRYDEAGLIYGRLAETKRLPVERRDPWAYCRMVDVVRQINEGPGSAEAWTAIESEISAIRELSPKNWYAEYLRNLVSELASKGKTAPNGRLVVRGSSPDEPEAAPPARPAPRATPQPTPRPTSERDAWSPPDHNPLVVPAGQSGQTVNNWKVWETPNFRILHDDEALAQKVGQVAEVTRQKQQRLWASVSACPNWQPRCDIYLYPNAEVFVRMTGQPAESPGFSTMGLNAGAVVARRINLRADHANFLKAVLPHEVTHVVLADLFTTAQIPRWADEGLAVLAEPLAEQDLRAADLNAPLEGGALFPVEQLMTMDYPDAQYWSLYYAQSVSMTRFLVEMGTPKQFIEFVRGCQQRGMDAELKRVYQIEGTADLEERVAGLCPRAGGGRGVDGAAGGGTSGRGCRNGSATRCHEAVVPGPFGLIQSGIREPALIQPEGSVHGEADDAV